MAMVEIRYSGYTIDTKWPTNMLFKSQWGKPGKRWYANAQVTLVDAKTGREVGDYYGIIIASPEFIRRPRKGVSLGKAYTYIMDSFDEDILKQEIMSRVGKVKAKDWDDLHEQMSRYFWID